jgi:predicted O-methyltransferase YrrM
MVKTKINVLSGITTKVLDFFGIKKRPRPSRTAPPGADDALSTLDPRFRSRLLSMYRGEPQLGADGQIYSIDDHTRISPSEGLWLYSLCVSLKPKATVEIGMAYGYSTLYFLASLAKLKTGHHTAIDPLQSSLWHGIGLTHTRAVAPINGAASGFAMIEDRSDRAATDLARAKRIFEIIFIDGNHRFDDVLVDFYLYASRCAIGGYIILDDMWMKSVQTVAAFVRANRRDFTEVPTGERNIAVFKKIRRDSREWNDFHEFSAFAAAIDSLRTR